MRFSFFPQSGRNDRWFQNTWSHGRGLSTYPLAQLTLLYPTSIEDEAEAGSESEGANSYQNI